MKRINVLLILIFTFVISSCSSRQAILPSNPTTFLNSKPTLTPTPSIILVITPTATDYQAAIPTFTNQYTSAGVTDIQAKAIDKGAQAFLDAVKSDDKMSVSGMIDYPLSTDINGVEKQVMIKDEFITKYDYIFTDSFKAGLAHATIINNMKGNWSGVFMLIHNGQVWFNTDGKISSISWWGN